MALGDTGSTGASERANSIQAILSAQITLEAERTTVWDQFTYTPEDAVLPTGGRMAGQTVTLRFQESLPISTALSPIPEKADIDPQEFDDNVVSVTVDEYGNTAQPTEWARHITKGDLDKEIAEGMAENSVAVHDRLAMRQYIGAPVHLFPNGNSAKSGLDATNDTLLSSSVGLSFLGQAQSMLRSRRVPGFNTDKDGRPKYSTVVHSLLMQDVPLTSGYLSALQMREGSDTLFNGEVMELNGLKFMESSQGKVYPSAGATAQAATTLNGAVSKGATSIVVTSATGLAVGDFVAIGAVETDNTDSVGIESVLITAVNGTTLTIAGAGYSTGDVATSGLRYAHATGVAVTEAATVAAIPIFGPKAVMKAYAGDLGAFGEARVTGPFDRLGRFKNYGWYSIVGWARTMGLWIIVPEVACAQNSILINE